MSDSPDPRPRVGYIGLGNMGAAMALNLVDRGWPMQLYARREATLEPFRDLPVSIWPTPAEVGSHCAILCLCVVDAHQIDEILFGANGAVEGLSPGAIVVVHSTIAPEACRDIAARLRAYGIGFLDAPVTGADERGRNGTLTIPVGGAPADVAKCRALLDAEGSSVIHLGDVGAGQIGKLLNNGLFILQLSLVDEIRRLGGGMGLDPDAVLDVIASGTASSWAAGFHKKMADAGKSVFDAYETSYPGGVVAIIRKDAGLFVAELERHGLGASRMAGLAGGAVDAML